MVVMLMFMGLAPAPMLFDAVRRCRMLALAPLCFEQLK
jgi:hypothetical protein